MEDGLLKLPELATTSTQTTTTTTAQLVPIVASGETAPGEDIDLALADPEGQNDIDDYYRKWDAI